MNPRKWSLTSLAAVMGGALVLAACAPAAPPAPTGLLADILARGTLVVSTDPAYPPQSELVEGPTRAANTQCASDQHTATEFTGFDIDVAVEIAKRLGVEACFVTPDWTLIIGGSWADRWDISVGSMTITPERMEVLYFTQPYYTTPAAFFVHQDNTTFSQPSDLSGKKVGVCAGCTYEYFLDKTLSIPGETINFIVEDASINGYDTDTSALQDLALGDGVRLDAVLTALPTGQGVIADGLPLKQLGDPVFFEYLAAAVDKSHSKDATSFVRRVTEIMQQMHADGTLLRLSQQYYGEDLTSAAAQFDVGALGQLS
ncbi:MAG: transporter substrate-binding domain-containing protein [Chloroflexi bacterium]|nr:transporter substrate-binding domain-containing protein [Chloroflexota bacterium]